MHQRSPSRRLPTGWSNVEATEELDIAVPGLIPGRGRLVPMPDKLGEAWKGVRDRRRVTRRDEHRTRIVPGSLDQATDAGHQDG